MSKPLITIGCIFRPHITEPEHGECWCKPRIVECTCGDNCGPVVAHNFPEVRPDEQERMAVFSEQIPVPHSEPYL